MSENLHPHVLPAGLRAPSPQPGAAPAPGPEPIRIGLALSGGAAKAVAHVGVLKALTEAGMVVESLAGTSGGSIVGALYATGRTVDDLERLALSLSWKAMAQVSLSRWGFLSSDRIERFLIGEIGDVTFDQLATPFAVVATNLVTGRRHVFREGRVALACRASCSIPQVYRPVEIEGNYFVDGGLVEELPLATLATEFRPALKVGVNLVAHGQGVKPRHLFHLAWQVGSIVARQSATAMEPWGDVIVKPELSLFSGINFRRVPDMIAEGYRAGQVAAGEIKALVAARAATAEATRLAAEHTHRHDAKLPFPIVLPPSGA